MDPMPADALAVDIPKQGRTLGSQPVIGSVKGLSQFGDWNKMSMKEIVEARKAQREAETRLGQLREFISQYYTGNPLDIMELPAKAQLILLKELIKNPKQITPKELRELVEKLPDKKNL